MTEPFVDSRPPYRGPYKKVQSEIKECHLKGGNVYMKPAQRAEMIKASAFYEEKLKNAPDNALYHHMLAAMSIAGGDNASGLDHFRASISSSNNVMTRNDMALHMARTENLKNPDRFKEVMTEFKKALVLAGDDQPVLHKNISAVYAAKGDFTLARDHTRRALEISPNDAANHRNISKIMDELGDQRAALRHNMEAMRLDIKNRTKPNSSSYRAAAVQNLVKGGDMKESIKLLSAARKIENKVYECSTTIRTQEIISKIMKRIGDPLDDLEKEEREVAQRKALQDSITSGSTDQMKPAVVRLGRHTREGGDLY